METVIYKIKLLLAPTCFMSPHRWTWWVSTHHKVFQKLIFTPRAEHAGKHLAETVNKERIPI